MLAAKEPDKPAGAREEKTEIDGRKARWYHTRIANRPDARSRMAVIELGEERWTQVWIDAPSEAALQAAMDVVRNQRFDPASMADANTRQWATPRQRQIAPMPSSISGAERGNEPCVICQRGLQRFLKGLSLLIAFPQ